MLSRAELLKMREMTFEDIDPKEIQDVEKLNIDVKKSKPEKIREILESGKNPYFLKYKGITIAKSLNLHQNHPPLQIQHRLRPA